MNYSILQYKFESILVNEKKVQPITNLGFYLIKKGWNGHVIKFQEIEIAIFQEIESFEKLIRRSKRP